MLIHVRLVPHQDFNHVLLGVLFDFADPALHALEALLVSHVVDDHDAVRALVVAAGDGFETVLPGGVPLKL